MTFPANVKVFSLLASRSGYFEHFSNSYLCSRSKIGSEGIESFLVIIILVQLVDYLSCFHLHQVIFWRPWNVTTFHWFIIVHELSNSSECPRNLGSWNYLMSELNINDKLWLFQITHNSRGTPDYKINVCSIYSISCGFAHMNSKNVALKKNRNQLRFNALCTRTSVVLK